MRLRVLIFAVLALALWCSQAQAESISVDHVDGLIGPDAVQMDAPITFHIRMTNDVGNPQLGITNGFRVYSPTGAEWTTTTADTTGVIGEDEFDLVWIINDLGVTGSGADTIGIGGVVMVSTGMPAGFDEITHTITIGPIDQSYQGGEICLDSAFYPPSGVWKWAGPEQSETTPSWDGPHCYTIGQAGPEPPVIACPDPVSEDLCASGAVCVDVPISGEELTVTVDGDATWDAGQLCFDADTSGIYAYQIVASNSGGDDTCNVTVEIAINSAPTIALPDDDTVTTCSVEEVCYQYSVADPDAGDDVTETLIFGAGTIDTLDNSICLLTETAGDFMFIVESEDACGAADRDTLIVTVIVNDSTTLECPAEPVEISLCEPGEICIPLTGSNVDEFTSNIGAWADEELCFQADTAGTYTIDVEASGPCNTVECTFSVVVTLDDGPSIACPGEAVPVSLCAPGEACYALPIQGADEVTSSYGSWVDDELCFTADTAGSYSITVTAVGPCGESQCQLMFNVTMGEEPEIACPTEPVEVEQIPGEEHCVAVPITGADTVWVQHAHEGWTAGWFEGEFCFDISTAGSYAATIIANSDCGADTCDITIEVNPCQLPIIGCPDSTVEYAVCEPGEICVDLEIDYYEDVTVEGATWNGDWLCFDAQDFGLHEFTVIASNSCGDDTCTLAVDVTEIPAPEIDCFAEPIVVTVQDDPYCMPMAITDYDSVVVFPDKSDWLPGWENDTLCFDASTVGTYYASVVAYNDCGETYCNIEVEVIDCVDPVIECPTDTIEITLCDPYDPCELCIALPISNAAEVTVDPDDGYWHDDSLCFMCDGPGYYTFTVTAHAEPGCEDAVCEVVVNVKDWVPTCSEMVLSDTALYFDMEFGQTYNPDPQTTQVTTPDEDFCFELAQASGYDWLSLPDSGCTWEDLTVSVDGLELLPGMYSAEVAVIGDANEVCEPAVQYFTVYLEVHPQQSEQDVLSIPTVPGVPGAHVEVPVSMEFVCDLYSVSATFEFMNDYFTFDSATFEGSLIEDWYNLTVTGVDGQIMLAADDDGGMIEPAIGNLVTLHFTVLHGTPLDFYPIDAMDAVYEMACTPPITEEFEPTVVPGGIVIGEPDNYVCGYVVDPDMNPIEGATVELWPDYPTGTWDDRTFSDATGLFEFFNSTVVPFDLHAYKEGYYPATVENLDYGQTGIMIVLTPIEDDITPTDQWVNFYCEFNTLRGEPFPVGTVIDAYDPDGVHCGSFTVHEVGAYGFMPVYRDDPWSPEDEGAEEGDIIRLYVNGIEAYPFVTPYWTGNGDVQEICLDVDGIETHTCELAVGWNLISWPIDTDVDDIETVLGSLGDAVEVVLGFEQGGLTWDPEYPLFSTLEEVDHLSGYWIKMNAPATLEITGSPVAATTPIMLNDRWNLVSYLPDMTMSPEAALASILGDLDVALGFDDGYSIYDPDDAEHSNLEEMGQCHGYWLRVDGPAQLLYPGSGPVLAPQRKPEALAAKAAADDVLVTRNWMNLYSEELTLDGQTVSAGTRVTAHTATGETIGSFTVAQDGLFGFMPVYGSDESPDGHRAVSPGEEFHLEIGGVEVNETFTWTTNGDRIEVTGLTGKAHGSTDVLPEAYSLAQNYPNPFNPTTAIGFSLPTAMKARVEIYNVLGRLVAVPFDGMAASGYNEVVWDGRSDNGSEAASGVYFYRLTTEEYMETRKMTLLK